MDGEIVFDMVDHFDKNGIIFSSNQSGSRVTSVHSDNRLG